MGKNLYVVSDDNSEKAKSLLEAKGILNFFTDVQGNDPLTPEIEVKAPVDQRVLAVFRLENKARFSPVDTVFVCHSENGVMQTSDMRYTVVAAFWEDVDLDKLKDLGATRFVHDPEIMAPALQITLPRGQWKPPQNKPA